MARSRVLANAASASIVPALGEHFYYAKVTQNDGNILWSAPVWVTQTNGTGDYIKPTVSASVTGNSGDITLSANASDDTGVTMVEFYVDNALILATGLTPYTATLNSTTLSNGNHRLVAKAYDAANNIGSSAAGHLPGQQPDRRPRRAGRGGERNGPHGCRHPERRGDRQHRRDQGRVLCRRQPGRLQPAPCHTRLALDSTLLTNGSHSVMAKAYDAANNIGSSSAFAFTIDNPDVTAPVAQAGESGHQRHHHAERTGGPTTSA